MSILYFRLFDLLSRKGIKKTEFAKMAGISTTTMAKLSSNQIVQTDILDKICEALGVQPSDIMEFIPSKTEKESADL